MYSSAYVWAKVLGHMESRLTPQVVSTWFDDTEILELTDEKLVLYSPSSFRKDIILRRCVGYIKEAMQEIFQLNVDVVVLDDTEIEAYRGKSQKPEFIEFNPQFTFDNFVVGSSNRFAHAAAVSVANNPAETYNPLFIYGPSGLGKTHLMHAIGHRILKNNPSARIVYITTETFTNDLIQSIQENSRVQFRNKYRTADVLIIDDIQFLVAKDRTQEEFFNTFNALHTYGKQIIISSDKAPKDLINLEDRLVSRFEGGLVADIQPPDLETRVAILKRKAQSEQIDVSEDVLTFIAEKVNSNIRQLEGSLIRVIAFARLTKKPIDLALTATALKDIVAGYDNTPVTIPLVQQVVSDYYDIDMDALLSQRRSMDVTYPRQMAMYLCKELTNKPLKAIGASFGGRDHSTVINACKRIETDMKNDPQVSDLVEDLTKRIKKQ